ncbi:unnamed protein product [Diamesa tonsa]
MNRVILIALIASALFESGESIDCNASPKNVEHRLKAAIFCNGYDKSQRPVKDHRTVTNMAIKMLIKSYDYVVIRWTDEYLKWNPSDYEQTLSIDVSSDSIWRPDMSLYNADLAYGIGSCHTTSCLINGTGNVLCIEPCTYTAHCKADFTRWPFDKQSCSMTFGSWMDTGEELNYIADKTTVSKAAAVDHSEWKLISSSVEKKVSNLTGAGSFSTLPTLVYKFDLERHSALTKAMITAPALILPIINLVILFLLSPDMSERIVLLGFSFLIHFQEIHQVTWMSPHNGETSPRSGKV